MYSVLICLQNNSGYRLEGLCLCVMSKIYFHDTQMFCLTASSFFFLTQTRASAALWKSQPGNWDSEWWNSILRRCGCCTQGRQLLHHFPCASASHAFTDRWRHCSFNWPFFFMSTSVCHFSSALMLTWDSDRLSEKWQHFDISISTLGSAFSWNTSFKCVCVCLNICAWYIWDSIATDLTSP